MIERSRLFATIARNGSASRRRRASLAAIGRRAAELRHALERRGERIGPLDTLIAATALTHNATLVMRNMREFGRVEGLKVLDWHG